jgi:hypothetical protein
MKFKHAFLCGLALASANAMACYTVYDARDRVVYQGVEAPVDMSMHLREALAARGYAAGSRMEFDLSTSCAPVNLAQVARPTSGDVPPGTIRMERSGKQATTPSSSAPLLTDRATAMRSQLPHTVVAGNIVVVPAQAAARVDLPTFTVIPADTVALAAVRGPDTRAMGAGPARDQTVITEMRDGTRTIQQGSNAAVRLQ